MAKRKALHVPCRSWLERQQNCPTCRASVFTANNSAEQQQQQQAGQQGQQQGQGGAQVMQLATAELQIFQMLQ